MVEEGAQIETIWSLLDLSDPFEWDMENLPHLFKRPMYGPEDALDVMADSPVCYEDESEGSADWLIVGEVPGGEVLVVPVTTSAYSGYAKLRPITIFKAPMHIETRYRLEGTTEYE